jgi:hypothetical protein
MEERFDKLLEKLDKAVVNIGLVEWVLIMLVGIRIATLIAD